MYQILTVIVVTALLLMAVAASGDAGAKLPAQQWHTSASPNEAALVTDPAAPVAGQAWEMSPGAYELACSYPAKLSPGRYRFTFYFRLRQAVGTQLYVLCSGAADQPFDQLQAIYPTQPTSANYLALPLEVTVTRPDPRLWLVVKFQAEPEPRRVAVAISPEARVRFGGLTLEPLSEPAAPAAGPLQVTVGAFTPSPLPKCWPLAHVFADGTTLLGASNDPSAGWQVSADRKTWRPLKSKAQFTTILDRPGAGVLALGWQATGDDPTALPGLRYRAPSGQAWAAGQITTDSLTYDVPLALGGKGEGAAYQPTCVVEKSLVPLPDGSLLASVYGWLHGQADLVDATNPHGDTRYSTWFVRSVDDGKHWDFWGQVPYLNKTLGGREGFCEPSVVRFPNTGELLCVMRTGSGFPLYQSRSSDDGQTWSAPQPLVGAMHGGFTDPGVMRGVWPSLVLLRNGVVACSWGRTPPGVHVAFSRDRGKTWGQVTTLCDKSMSSYLNMQEIRPNVLLMTYDNNEVVGFQEVTVAVKNPAPA
jgi:hypothetical protein